MDADVMPAPAFAHARDRREDAASPAWLRWSALAAAGGSTLALLAAHLGWSGPWHMVSLALAGLTLACLLTYLIAQRRREHDLGESLARARRDEETVSTLQQELVQHTRLESQLMEAKQAAEAAAMAKGEFLATMSHEIRTPLNGVVPMLDLLMHANLAPEHKELVRTAYASSQQLLRIVDDILDYSKLEADRLVLESTAFNLRELLEAVLEMMERPAETKGLRLHLQIDSNVRLPVRADPVRLRQVLTNLVSNAIKFTDRGTVTVVVRRMSESAAQHRVRFEVRDTGIGIEPEAQARLFQAFSQADASTTRLYGGTGLGLAICKRIVELMGGRIGVNSQPRQGAAFWFEVPLLKVHGDIATSDAAVSGGRLLLVSADAQLRMRLNMLLPNWGFRVTAVETTQEALDRLRTAAPQGAPWAYTVVLADLAGMRDAALALRRNLERRSVYGEVRLVCLYADEYPPADLQAKVTALSRQAPDADLREALSRPPRPAAEREGIAMPARAGNAGELRHARVLLVEDNPVNLMVGQRLLGVLGVQCDTAANGEAALMRMSASRYDLVLMDCQMPVLDGYAATRRWREDEAAGGTRARLPIVAMTANAMAGDRQKCLDAGMDDYLPKPVTRAELERCLHRWYKRPAASGTTEGTPAAVPPDASPSSARAIASSSGPAPHAVPAAADPAPAMATAAVAAPAAPIQPAQAPDPAAREPAPEDPLDRTVLAELRELLGDEVAQLVRVFLDDAPKLVRRMENAAARPDYPMLYQAAHALKSSSANLGAMRLSAAAKRIEMSARAEALDRPAVAVAMLAEEYERVRKALQSDLRAA